MFWQWLDRKYSGDTLGVLEIEAAVETVDTILSEDNSDEMTDTIHCGYKCNTNTLFTVLCTIRRAAKESLR